LREGLSLIISIAFNQIYIYQVEDFDFVPVPVQRIR